MDEKIKATIVQRLERLPDDTARQLLDYIEFLESKYNRSTRDRSPFERLAENVEGTLRASRIGGAAIRGTAQVLDAASSVVRGVADAGRVVVEELQRLDISEEERAQQRETGEQAEGEQPEQREQGGDVQSATHAKSDQVKPEAEAAAGGAASQTSSEAEAEARGDESDRKEG